MLQHEASRGQSHFNRVLHGTVKVITLLTLYMHIIKIIHLCYSELLWVNTQNSIPETNLK